MEKVPKHKRRLLSDLFNTILDIKWRWHVVIFILTFMISWFIFATVWYSIAFVHGDLDNNDEPSSLTASVGEDQNQNATDQFNAHFVHLFVQALNQSTSDERLSAVNIDTLMHANFSELLKMLPFDNTLAKAKSAAEKTEVHTPCVHGIHDFTSALLYSVETQHTIGYGLRHITEECHLAIIFLMIQSCFGIFVQGLVAGVVFAKISRPNKRK